MSQELTVQEMLERRARRKTNGVITQAREIIRSNPYLSGLRFNKGDGISYTLLQVLDKYPVTRSAIRVDFEDKTNIAQLENKIFENFLEQEIQDLERIMNKKQ